MMLTLASLNRRNSNQSKRLGVGWFAGLDIGTHIAKLVAGRMRAGIWQIQVASTLPVTWDASIQATDLRSCLQPWIEECLPGAMDCFASPPSSLVDYEMLEWSTEGGDIDSYTRTALEEILGDSVDQVSHDGWLSKGERTSTLHLTWMSTDTASELAKAVNGSGVYCRSLDAPALALARLANSNSKVLIVDIGRGEVSFIWSHHGQTEYIRNRIRFESDSAAQRLAGTLEITEASAETLLCEYGIKQDGSNWIARNNACLLGTWLERLIFEIRRTVHYISSRNGPDALDQIILCGGGAHIQHLQSYLANHLEMPVELPELPNSCRWQAAQPFSPLFAQAVSLAMQGVSR